MVYLGEMLEVDNTHTSIIVTKAIDAIGWICNNAASALQDTAGPLQTIQLVCQGMAGGKVP